MPNFLKNPHLINEIFYKVTDNPAADLLKQVRACAHCQHELPLGARPVLSFHPESKILIVGQAPSLNVHKTGLPWNDASGDRLRKWLKISEKAFYDPLNCAIIPKGLCYPGTTDSGDKPPRKECAELWFNEIHKTMPKLSLILAIGRHAQSYYMLEAYNTYRNNLLQKQFKLDQQQLDTSAHTSSAEPSLSQAKLKPTSVHKNLTSTNTSSAKDTCKLTVQSASLFDLESYGIEKCSVTKDTEGYKSKRFPLPNTTELVKTSINLHDLTFNYFFNGVPVITMPHPSPRNNIWLDKNRWFERDYVDVIAALVADVFAI